LHQPQPRSSINRRPRVVSARRLPFALGAVLALAAWSTVTASADQTVVSATVYPSTRGPVSHHAVALQTLTGCPPYSGTNPIYLYPPDQGQPYQLTATSWSLSTVLTCGLQIPLGDVTGVQVLTDSRGFQETLSNADVSDPRRYRDAQAPDALPVISVDGPENQTTYTRPFRGPGDDNARDQVTETGAPITLVVYANGPSLIVSPSTQKLSATAATTTIKLAATVQSANGSSVPAGALTWSWSFGDSTTTSTASSPNHRYAPGSYFATVQVTDRSIGAGGTATIQVTTPASTSPGKQTQPGGKHHTKSKSPNGADKGGRGGPPGANAGSKSPGVSDQGQTGSGPTNPATNPAATDTTPATAKRATPASPQSPSTTSAPTLARHAASQRPVAPRRPRHSPARRTSPARLVTGRLISDVAPLPAGTSPLVRAGPAAAAPAPAVRRATRASSLFAIGAALLVVMLLSLGAWRELRGRRRSQAGPAGQ
jgi:hypothetical protein